MRRLLLPLVLAAAACGAGSDPADNSGEWLHVLRHKKAAVAPNATAQQKQAYADSLGAFVQKPLTSIISIGKHPITRVGQLAGKTVGTAGIAYQTAYLRTILARAHVPASSEGRSVVPTTMLFAPVTATALLPTRTAMPFPGRSLTKVLCTTVRRESGLLVLSSA